MKTDEIMAAMSDENVRTVGRRFEKGETVEFHVKNKWRPAKVLTNPRLIVDEAVEKADDESFISALNGGFDFFIRIEYTTNHKHIQTDVLQASKRLQTTNTHIHKGHRYYKRMVRMMLVESRFIKQKREKRITRRLTAVQVLNRGIWRVDTNRDTKDLRAHFSTFIRPGTTLDSKTIKPSGSK
jgi:hypothetical protein